MNNTGLAKLQGKPSKANCRYTVLAMSAISLRVIYYMVAIGNLAQALLEAIFNFPLNSKTYSNPQISKGGCHSAKR